MHKNCPWPVLTLLITLLFATLTVAAELPTTNRPERVRTAPPSRGEVLALQTNSITAMPFVPARNSAVTAPETFTIDDNTRIFLGRTTRTTNNAPSHLVQSLTVEPAKRDALKVGQRVRIQAAGGKAVQIIILPERPASPTP